MADTAAPFDIAIVGAGIVGASIAYHLGQGTHGAARLRVLLLEAESDAGYHTTGRSAALFTEGYGPPGVRALTRASRAFFASPPAGFAEHPLITARGALFTATADQGAALDALHDELHAEGVAARRLDGNAVRALVPVLRPEASAFGLLDEGACDIDVHALLHGYLHGARGAGASWRRESRVTRLEREGGLWRVALDHGEPLFARCIVNAAGAWADEVAALAGVASVGLEPRRRTAFVFRPPEGLDIARWPAVVALDESWYLKPDAGLLLGSPANADPAPPHDVVPEELDVALGIHRIEAATTLSIRRPQRAWAGLRCFVPDGEPVCGFEPDVEAFFWAAALGGYGIQSSPAFGRLCAALLRGLTVPRDLLDQGFTLHALAPRPRPHGQLASG